MWWREYLKKYLEAWSEVIRRDATHFMPFYLFGITTETNVSPVLVLVSITLSNP